MLHDVLFIGGPIDGQRRSLATLRPNFTVDVYQAAEPNPTGFGVGSVKLFHYRLNAMAGTDGILAYVYADPEMSDQAILLTLVKGYHPIPNAERY